MRQTTQKHNAHTEAHNMSLASGLAWNLGQTYLVPAESLYCQFYCYIVNVL